MTCACSAPRASTRSHRPTSRSIWRTTRSRRNASPAKAFADGRQSVQSRTPERRLRFTFRGVADHEPGDERSAEYAGERFEADQFLFLLDHTLHTFDPEILLTYGAHPLVQEAMRRGRGGGARVVFSLRNRGYENRQYFEHVDSVFTTSPFLSRVLRERIGLLSEGIESPIDWSEVEAPDDLRKFVTFVNPSPAKGSKCRTAGGHAWLAAPQHPILVVQSATSASGLKRSPGWTSRNTRTSWPHRQRPARLIFSALTRILLVPSTGNEPNSDACPAEALVDGNSANRQRSWRAARNTAAEAAS